MSETQKKHLRRIQESKMLNNQRQTLEGQQVALLRIQAYKNEIRLANLKKILSNDQTNR